MALNEWLLKHKQKFLYLAIAGWAIQVVAMLIIKPWEAGLGVSSSPQRQWLRFVFEAWLPKIPSGLYGMAVVCGHPKWLAPRGRYQEGREYPALTTYSYVAIALVAALFAASGVLSPDFFDLPAAPAFLSISFFSPVIGMFTLWLGGVLRAIIFGYGNPLMWLIGNGLSDGTTWIFLGILYWWFREETEWGKNPLYLLIYWVVIYVVWRTIWMFPIWVWLDPVPALWTRMTWFFTNFLPAGILGTTAGLIVVEALIRAVERGREAPVVGE